MKEFEFNLTKREGFQQKFIFAPTNQDNNGPLYLFTKNELQNKIKNILAQNKFTALFKEIIQFMKIFKGD